MNDNNLVVSELMNKCSVLQKYTKTMDEKTPVGKNP